MGRCQRRPVTLSRPPLAAALAEYGRLVRTNILLAYLADAPLRRRIGAREPTVPRGASEPPACRR